MEAAGFDRFDWMLWRVITSPLIRDDLYTIKHKWTLTDLAEAHIALDAAEALTPDPPKLKKK